MRILCDVDGVVADMMGGFRRWFDEKHGIYIDLSLVDRHSIEDSDLVNLPELKKFDMGEKLKAFLKEYAVYQRYVSVIHCSREAISSLYARGHTVTFVTATLSGCEESLLSKMVWLRDNFPGVKIIAASAKEKPFIIGDLGIDDRYDTCLAWRNNGVKSSLVFRQPWNEAPLDEPRVNWLEILDLLK